MKKIESLFYLFFPLLIGGLVGLITAGNFDYENLISPPLAPPKILFPIAWSIIYLLMGLAYYLYKRNSFNNDGINKVYYIQLIVNALWSIIFFLLKWRFIAIVWIILLLCLVAYLIYLFYHNYRLSAYLNIPYILWVGFATYLTIGIYILN